MRADGALPFRNEVVRILERPGTDFDKQMRLKALRGGRSYDYICSRWLDSLRYAQCYVYMQPVVAEPVCTDTLAAAVTEPACVPADTLAPPVVAERPCPLSRWHISTNLLHWAALAWNGGLEYSLTDRSTIQLSGSCAWWSHLSHKRVYRWMTGELAYHYYLHKGFRHSGFFVGAYTQTGLFELMFGEKNRKGEFVSGGVTGGYRWRLKERMSLIAELGVGYMYIDYRYAVPIDGVLIRQGHNRASYAGPTRLSLSLVYDLKCKGR